MGIEKELLTYLEQNKSYLEGEGGDRARNTMLAAMLAASHYVDDKPEHIKDLDFYYFAYAEFFNSLKPIPGKGHIADQVRATICDWLRHVQDAAPKRIKLASEAVEDLQKADFEAAREAFIQVGIREDEFKFIEDYYKGLK